MIHLASDTFIVFQVFNIHESSSKYLPVLVGGRAAIRSESDIAGLARRRKNGVFLSVLGSDDMQLLDNVSGEVTPQPQRKRSRSVDAMMLAPSLCVNDSEYRRKPPLTSDALLDRNVSRSQSDTEENGPDQVFEALALPVEAASAPARTRRLRGVTSTELPYSPVLMYSPVLVSVSTVAISHPRSKSLVTGSATDSERQMLTLRSSSGIARLTVLRSPPPGRMLSLSRAA